MSDSFEGKRVLITGGAGFIGSNLAMSLVRRGASVTIIDSMIPEYGGNLFNLEPVKGDVILNISDVRDGYAMEHLIKGAEWLFNLAGQVSHIDSMTDPFKDLEINIWSQVSILEACRKYNRDVKIVFTSTRQIYGRPSYLPMDEKHPLLPIDVNGINKMAGERYHLLYHEIYGIMSCSLRLTNTYGPRQLVKHNRQGFMGWFIRRLVENEPIDIFGDGEQLRDFNYVGDVVDALLIAAETPEAYGQIYNLGGDAPLSLKSLVEKMIHVNGGGRYSIVPFPAEKKKIDIGDAYCDWSKIKEHLGWSPRTPIDSGLRMTLEFYREHLAQYL